MRKLYVFKEKKANKHMATRQNNLGAYQTEVSGNVGAAGAEALGKMGENGVGNINMGNGSNAGFNPMTMMAGISLGNAVGQKMVGTLNTALSPEQQGVAVPPPVPSVKYYVAKNGKTVGPFDMDALANMISTGEFNSESLVWKEGMSEWKPAGTESNLAKLFPPMIPN